MEETHQTNETSPSDSSKRNLTIDNTIEETEEPLNKKVKATEVKVIEEELELENTHDNTTTVSNETEPETNSIYTPTTSYKKQDDKVWLAPPSKGKVLSSRVGANFQADI